MKTLNEYQMKANGFISEDGKKNLILNGVLGLSGESGECADIVKKHLFQGHDLNKDKLKDELGDVLWYIAETALGLGITLEDIANYNIEKLTKRFHGETFNKEDSINREE
ncbi:MAG: nucleoside triphosphate pyrophosphohydrolase family protein [Bacilli bacterium]|nr:nucleoside triphosphate pyrophosphohydrolase family protein [Bacilli bacterium]